ncbi:MAG: hypothetical protein AAF226_09585, partial [Verrucomicrobiota bacterium]
AAFSNGTADAGWATLGVNGQDPSGTLTDGAATPTALPFGTTRIWVPFDYAIGSNTIESGAEFAALGGFTNPPPAVAGGVYSASMSAGATFGTTNHNDVHFVEHPVMSSLGVGGTGPDRVLSLVSAYNPAVNDGDVLYTVQFPFGSYAPGQPPVRLDFEAQLDPGAGAQIDQTMFIRTMGGFALGCDPLNNPLDGPAPDDPPVGGINSLDTVTQATRPGPGGTQSLYGGHLGVDSNGGGMGSDYITPKVVEIKKDEQSNNHENATGPSNVIHYRIDVDIAEGQRLEDIVISDVIPDELVYVPNSVTISINGNAASSGLTVYQPWEINPGSGYDAGLFQTGAGGSGQLDEMEARDFGNLNGGLLQVLFDEVTADSLDGEDEFLLFRDGDGRLGDGGRWDITIEYQAYAPEFYATPGDVTIDSNGIPVPTSSDDFFDDRVIGGEVLGYVDGGLGTQTGNNPNTAPVILQQIILSMIQAITPLIALG